ncbi:hypothetical protein HH_0858 [Helicobacter hepaticus ATCC 51449]|uniref:Uncharacterized protein n=1 Tax=Helicobacter hepaticus (strain ATCC 51449 / 3B1) TaxID=235279 RepID=Q7VHV5_HELHP|nr:hypothetical protein HH_0858 [Helicobacter hepaticus ATCC 51449]
MQKVGLAHQRKNTRFIMANDMRICQCHLLLIFRIFLIIERIP